MTIEQKAKRYDEALEKSKRLYEQGTITESLCYVFPELKENEDEKIRKWLIAQLKIKVGDNATLNNMIYKALAWLEKQGQNFTKKDVDDAYLKGVTNTKNEIEKQYEANYQIRKDIATFIFNYRGDIKDRTKWIDYLGIKVSLIEKQGEQKPAWSEGDKEQLDRAIYMMEQLDMTKSWDDVYNWLKSLKNRVLPKQEWIEEDNETLDRIISNYQYFCKKLFLKDGLTEVEKEVINNVDKEDINWLKSLKDRIQPKQEWSEEEKGRIDKIIDVLDWAEEKGRINYNDWEDYVEYVRTLRPQSEQKWYKVDNETQKKIINYFEAVKEQEPTRMKTLESWINWLKSLKDRYTWKPSDEQMEALANALSLAKNCGEESAFDLRILYEQLKKLMKE